MKKNISLTEAPIKHALIKLSLPLLWGMVIAKMAGLVEMYFISRLGTEALAANSYLFPVFSGFISLSYGIGIGAAVIAAQALGANNSNRAADSTLGLFILLSGGGALFITICLTILPSILLAHGADQKLYSYMVSYISWASIGIMPLAWTIALGTGFRAAGRMASPSLAIAISSLFNMLLDVVLIPRFGLAGAGAASSAAYIISFIYIYFAWRRQPPVKLEWHNRFNFVAILKTGLPIAVGNAVVPFAFSVMLGLASHYGNHAVAALGITGRIETFALILISAMCGALMPLISQNFGANSGQRTEAAIKAGLGASALIGLALGVGIFVFSTQIAAAFSNDTEVITMSSSFMNLLPLSYWAVGIFMAAQTSVNALGRTMHGFAMNMTRWLALTLPLAWLMSHEGVYAIVQANTIANIIACVFGLVWLRVVYKNT